MVGKFFESRRTEGITMKVVEYKEKFNTVIIEYLTGDKKGASSSITTSTLKRWWKEIELHEETIIVEPELSDEEYAEIGLEIAEQAKEKAEQHKKLVPMPGIEKLVELKKEYSHSTIEDVTDILNNFDVKPFPSTPNYLKISIKNGKGIGEVDVCKKGLTVYVNKKYRPEPNPMEHKEMSSSYQYKIPYDEHTLDILVSLF